MNEKTSDMMRRLVDAIGQVQAVVDADPAMPEAFRQVARFRLAGMRVEAETAGRDAAAIEAAVAAGGLV